MFIINWKNPTIDPAKAVDMEIPVAATLQPGVPGNNSSLILTGKGAPNYGQVQQQNIIRLLENFADEVAPASPTVGQLWFNSDLDKLMVCVGTVPTPQWKVVGGTSVTLTPPVPASLGDLWIFPTGEASCIMYIYTGVGRYGSPTPATEIGGWEQLWPTVDVIAGRNEYDRARELLEQLVGEATSSYGSGAVRRLITNLTNFAALDASLRRAWITLGRDPYVATLNTQEKIVTQAINQGTLFAVSDGGSPYEIVIGGSPTLANTPGSIFVEESGTVNSVAVPFGILNTDQSSSLTHYVMWARDNQPVAARPFYAVRQLPDGQWQYDQGGGATAWVAFTPAAGQFIIGYFTSSGTDSGNLIYPGITNCVLWGNAVEIVATGASPLKVEPNSNDWDNLLAALRYAVARLDVPVELYESISQLPFIRDGRQIDSSLSTLNPADPRYPTVERRVNRWPGVAERVNAYNDTMSTFSDAITNRYSLRGINGVSGVYPNLSPDVVVTPHYTWSGLAAGGGATVKLDFNFANEEERSRFIYSGGAIQLRISHVGGAGPGDLAMRSLITPYAVVRITADKVRFFSDSATLTLTEAPTNLGLMNGNNVGRTLSTKTQGPNFISFKVYSDYNFPAPPVAGPGFSVEVDFNVFAALTGTTTIAFEVIEDTSTY